MLSLLPHVPKLLAVQAVSVVWTIRMGQFLRTDYCYWWEHALAFLKGKTALFFWSGLQMCVFKWSWSCSSATLQWRERAAAAGCCLFHLVFALFLNFLLQNGAMLSSLFGLNAIKKKEQLCCSLNSSLHMIQRKQLDVSVISRLLGRYPLLERWLPLWCMHPIGFKSLYYQTLLRE